MPIERINSAPQGDIEIDVEMEDLPEIEIEFDEEGGVTVNLDESEDDVRHQLG
jgi:hypothetical protein